MEKLLKSVGDLFGREEVAKRLGIKPNTLDKWVRDGRFKKPLKVGSRGVRWTEEDVRDYLRQVEGSR